MNVDFPDILAAFAILLVGWFVLVSLRLIWRHERRRSERRKLARLWAASDESRKVSVSAGAGSVGLSADAEREARAIVSSAEGVAAAIMNEAQRAATKILDEAEQRASELLAGAKERQAQLEREVARLEELSRRNREGLSELLTSLLTQVRNPGRELNVRELSRPRTASRGLPSATD